MACRESLFRQPLKRNGPRGLPGCPKARPCRFWLVFSTVLAGLWLNAASLRAQGVETPPSAVSKPAGLSPSGSGSAAAEEPFWGAAAIKGAFYYFQRYRDRYQVDTGHYGVNLSQAASQASLEFSSGYLAGFLGVDLGVFGALDVYNWGAPDHEMNFVPWRNPWEPNWHKRRAANGASVYRARLKFKTGPLWAQGGYIQPQGPGVAGVNWSFSPGSYQGIEAGLRQGGLDLAAFWANEYKAPWFRETFRFRQNDGQTKVDYLWSAGARYQTGFRLNLELAYGESRNYLKNAHIKLKYHPFADESLYLTWQLYLMDDHLDDGSINDNFDGPARHHFLAAHYRFGPWRFQAEGLATWAPVKNAASVGYFAYRLTSRYGGSNGNYEPWWDLRSDWNHDQEKAVFVKIQRSLDDLLGLTGLTAGLSGAYGWGGQAYKAPVEFKEAAFGADLGYTFQGGRLEGGSLQLHYTRYDNKTNLPNWSPYQNAFQDEHDIKLSLVIPFTIK